MPPLYLLKLRQTFRFIYLVVVNGGINANDRMLRIYFFPRFRFVSLGSFVCRVSRDPYNMTLVGSLGKYSAITWLSNDTVEGTMFDRRQHII